MDQQVLFALPPNLEGYGQVTVPAAFHLLGSLLDQDGLVTDYLVAALPEARRSCPSEHLLEVDPRLPPPEQLRHFAAALAAGVERAVAGGRRPVLALSCFTSSLYLPTMLLGAWARYRFPRLPILVGGYHPTIAPASLLERVGTEARNLAAEPRWRGADGTFLGELVCATVSILARRDFVFDAVFRGRAEGSLPRVLRQLAETGTRPAAPVLVDSAPLSAAELRRFRYSPAVLSRLAGPAAAPPHPPHVRRFDLCFSLGCPHACAFCVNSSRHEPWHGFDPSYAVDLLGALHLEHQVQQFSVLDANFGASPTWRRQFFRLLAGRPWANRIQLDIQTSVTAFDLPDPELLDATGLTVQVGVESCSPEILLRMNKTRDPQRYRERLRRMVRRMAPHVDGLGLLLIFGFPGETRRTLRETLDFLLDDCDVLSHHNVALMPQLYLPLEGTDAADRTDLYRRELGFVPGRPAWWERDAARRFDGLRPSAELDLATCESLVSLLQGYFFGGWAHAQQAFDRPLLTVKTRLQRQRFRAAVDGLLAGT